MLAYLSRSRGAEEREKWCNVCHDLTEGKEVPLACDYGGLRMHEGNQVFLAALS